jgi:predicted CopG family antitoxin
MTSLLPKKKKGLDIQNLSVIKDDESQVSKSSKISKKEEDITPTSSGG